MKINFKKFIIVSTTAVAAAHLAHKCSAYASKTDEQMKEFVRIQNPNRYNTIMNSSNRNNVKAWSEALREVHDTLSKLNSDCAKGYFRANQLLNDTTKAAIKTIK